MISVVTNYGSVHKLGNTMGRRKTAGNAAVVTVWRPTHDEDAPLSYLYHHSDLNREVEGK